MSASPKDEAAARALAAMADLLVETARGDDRNKFVELMRLSEIAQRLKVATSRRVADFPKRDGYGGGGVNIVGQEVARAIARVHGGDPLDDLDGEDSEQPAHVPLDSHAMLRNVMLMVGPVFQGVAEQAKATSAAQEASELSALLQSQAEISCDESAAPELKRAIDERVARLAANVVARNKAHPPPRALPAPVGKAEAEKAEKDDVLAETRADVEKEDDHVPVVSADDERRHPLDGDERDDDLPASLRPDPERSEGDGRPP